MKYILDIGIFLLYLISSSYGLWRMKQAANVISAEFIVGFVFYGMGFIWWIFLLRRLPLSEAFPIAAGGLIVIVQLVGVYFLNEEINAYKVFGVLAILSGIVLIYSGSKI